MHTFSYINRSSDNAAKEKTTAKTAERDTWKELKGNGGQSTSSHNERGNYIDNKGDNLETSSTA
ncbi:hypothetical protein [Ktedonobacter racemifer]|uniref:hypothetical protein n=1 Tax=Ktedonobacter racemifer TaxID=363277 RepID=UPI00031C7550|nr:hypothetical protein [Ktedonobacter racemifer]